MPFNKSFRAHFDADILNSIRWQYFLNIGIGILGAAYIIALSRLLGPEQFGIYTLCAAIPAVLSALLDCRLQEFVLYLRENCDEAEFPDRVAALFWFDVLSKVLVVSFAAMAFIVLDASGYRGIYFPFVALSSLLVFAGKSLSGPSMGVLRSFGKLEYFSVIQVTDWFFRVLALGALFLFGHVTIAAAIWSQVISAGIFNLVVIRRAMKEIGLTGPKLLSGAAIMPQVVRRNAALIFANQGISAADTVVKELDVIVCGAFLTTPQVATYKVAKSMAAMAWRLADPIFIVIMPKLAKMCSSAETEKLTSFVKALLLALTPSALLLFVASVAGVALVGRYVLGEEYLEAVRLYPVASAWILIALPLIWTHPLSIASGKPALFFIGGGLGNAVGLLAIVLGAWRFGVEGALIGLSLAFCLPFVFSFFILRRFGVIRL